jgi:hypothetical protein
MTVEELRAALAHDRPPAGLSPLLLALWHDGRGNWDGAHAVAQDDPSPEASWVHAYLHRKEGDPSNAGYWYRRAGRPSYSGSLDEEWEAIARALLG